MGYFKEYLFHITDIENLDGILKEGGMWSKNKMVEKGLKRIDIAYEGIQDRRSRKVVPLDIGGVLHDFVPFYFAPRSPMLGAIHTGGVEGYEKGQQSIIYLIVKVSEVNSEKIPFVFTNGHSVIDYSEFFDDLGQLDEVVDWDIMRERYWNDTAEDPNRMFRRQAEFLIKEFISVDLMTGIAVFDEKHLEKVKQILKEHNMAEKVVIKNDWYF